MTIQEIEHALSRIKDNPHAIENYSKEELFDIMKKVQKDGKLAAEFYTRVWLNNKDNDGFKKTTQKEYVENGHDYKRHKQTYELIETQYNKLCEPNEIKMENSIQLDYFSQLKYIPFLDKWDNYLKHNDCEHWSEDEFKSLLDVQHILIEYKLSGGPIKQLVKLTPTEKQANKKQLKQLKVSYDLKFGGVKGGTNQIKLKWCGKPSHLAYIINQLVEKGFIDAPKHHGDISYRQLAEILLNVFEIEKKTTSLNMQKELNPLKNTTGDHNRKRIKIPNITELD